MNITSNLWIVRKHTGEIYHNLNSIHNEQETNATLKAYCLRILLWKKRGNDTMVKTCLNEYYNARTRILSAKDSTPADEQTVKVQIARNLINFFSEFSFEPNFRFINTLSHKAHQSYEQASKYCYNYFNLSGNDFASVLNEKMKSREWIETVKMMNDLQSSSDSINHRLKLYYGSQGTGKTTLAMKESNGVCVVCHSAMLPSDLMKDFTFIDGKATFKKSSLRLAMENGTKIVLDELNLLPLESLRFLQSLLDGKEQFIYEGETISIKQGFEVIGTMNLIVNGQVYGLPEPLIDRAYELREFKLTAEQLSKAF